MKFPSGARICFIGDSLTAANEILPRVIDFYKNTFQGEQFFFFNCGTSGGTYQTAIDFFPDDVLRHNPTHAVVCFGVNDSNRWELGTPRSQRRFDSLYRSFEDFKAYLTAYCALLKQHNIHITLCTPPPYDEYTPSEEPAFPGGYALIAAYAQFVRDFAAKNGLDLCDYHAYMTERLQVEKTPIYSPDHTHPVTHGYYLMAKCFLAHQGYALGEEQTIPPYFDGWRREVAKMRMIYGAEQMIIHNYAMPTDEKIALMQDKVEREDWGAPVFERFIRAFANEKSRQDALYKRINELYLCDILSH